MDPSQNNEVIQQFIKLLEENGRQGQAADLSALLWYMDGMNRQFDAVCQELQEVKAQLAYEKQPAVQKIMQGVTPPPSPVPPPADFLRKSTVRLRPA